MFNKLVAIEPVSLIPSAEEALHQYAKEVVLYRDIPASDDQIVQRIGDADAVLLSYTSRMGKNVIERCPNIRYIGMCCSLYSEESANVDIAYARTRGIKVLGIRDYGDRGVVEYVLHELTGILHGFGMPMLLDEPVEITGLKAGIIGLGVSGKMIADALQFMGADIAYYSRTRRTESFREISPQRLVHYRNYWYVDAFCHATNALRTFAIDNIRRVIVLGTTARRVPLHTIEYNLDQSYGLFMSGDPKLAVLRFDAEASPYLKRETWHPRQTLEEDGDEVVLMVPYTNPTELIGDIFRWREHVVVEAPEELRREVRECLLKTLSQY